jgi:hypothetical protein
MWKSIVEPEQPQLTIWWMRIAYVRLKTHIQNMKYLFIFQCSNSYANVPRFYVVRTLRFYILDIPLLRLSKQILILSILYKCKSVSKTFNNKSYNRVTSTYVSILLNRCRPNRIAVFFKHLFFKMKY